MKRASYNTSRFSSLFGVRKLLISCLLILRLSFLESVLNVPSFFIRSIDAIFLTAFRMVTKFVNIPPGHLWVTKNWFVSIAAFFIGSWACLFVPTNKKYELGEEVFILLALMDEPEKIPINGKVVWVTPKGAQGDRQAGIGVQFSESNFAAATKIEEHLGNGLVSDRPTHTMWLMRQRRAVSFQLLAADLLSPDWIDSPNVTPSAPLGQEPLSHSQECSIMRKWRNW